MFPAHALKQGVCLMLLKCFLVFKFPKLASAVGQQKWAALFSYIEGRSGGKQYTAV